MSTATATPPATLSSSADVTTEKTASARSKYRALEERTLTFAREVRKFVRRLPRQMVQSDDVQQLLRASGSIGANYIEANESLGKKDFVMRIRICLKEAKESVFWLRLMEIGNSERLVAEKERITKESQELLRIFFAILKVIRAKRKAALANVQTV